MVRALILCGVAIPFLLYAPSVRADVWTVAPDGSGDFTSIQEAIEHASPGDEIRIRPGTYAEALDLGGKAVALIGEGGADATIVDADSLGSAIKIPYTPTGMPVVRGLTFQNGNGTILNLAERDGRFGGGVFVEVAAPSFEDCRILGNRADTGGGVYVLSGMPRFARCQITGNRAGAGGGIATELDGGARFEECDISGNDAVLGGGANLFRGQASFYHCRLTGNSAVEGGGIRLLEAGEETVLLNGCLVAGNYGSEGIAINALQASIRVAATTIAAHEPQPFAALLEMQEGIASFEETVLARFDGGELTRCLSIEPSLRCVVAWPVQDPPSPCIAGDRVLFADPLFCDAAGGDYTLRPDSPCLAGQGSPGCPLIGALDVGCGTPVPIRRTSWGAVKGIYRR